MKAILFILSGLPDSSKPTLSQFLTRKYTSRRLCQIRDEQKTFGKINVNTEL